MTVSTYIIAEAGVNHNGKPDLAFQLIDLAKSAGANAIKFQTFTAEDLVTKNAKKAEYQLHTTKDGSSQLAMLKGLELPEEVHFELFSYCNNIGLEFLSTPFGLNELYFLVDKLGLTTIKLSSGDLTNAPLLYEAGKRKCNVILSTGMSNLSEIRAALGMLVLGYESAEIADDLFNYAQNVFCQNMEHTYLKNSISLLHCTTEYPASFSEVNLLAMDTMKKEFGLTIGLSDHTEGFVIPIAAVARGAAIIEKHITLDKTMEGPDHSASLSPEELIQMVSAIRNVECSFGNGKKIPTESERKNIPIIRKGLYAKKDIFSGEKLTCENIAIKRPENYLSPYDYWAIQGAFSKRPYKEDDVLVGIR